MDKDMDMGCVLSLGAMPSKFLSTFGSFFMPGQGATDRWVYHGHFYSRDSELVYSVAALN